MRFKERLIRFRSFWIFPSLAVLMLYIAHRAEPETSLKDLVWLFPLGVLAWTLIEYALHRFVFHIRFQFSSPNVREFVNASHIAHHAAPRDPNKLLVRTPYALMVSAVLFGALYAVFGKFLPAAGTLTGIWAGFLYYEAVHYRVHLTSSLSGLLAKQRR